MRQLSLLGDEPLGFDPALPGLVRRDLGSGAWVDTAVGWVRGAERLFTRVSAAAPWGSR